MERQQNYVDMAELCELASILTEEKCEEKKIILNKDRASEDDDLYYTEEAQDIFNNYLDLISNTLNV